MSNEKNESPDIVRNIQDLPIDKLKEFENHPFYTYNGERLDRLAASIKESGVLVPIIVREKKLKPPKANTMTFGEYEILSGHNRVKAAEKAGLNKIPAEIRDVDDDEAVIIVNETNLQQRNFQTDWLESEKARSISQYYESIKKQGNRSDLHPDTSVEIQQQEEQTDSYSRQKTALIYCVKDNIIEKYIQLNKLIIPLKNRLDKKSDSFGGIAARNIALLSNSEQETVHSLLEKYKLTVDKARQIRDLSKNKKFNAESVEAILKQNNDTTPKPYIIKSEFILKHLPNVPHDKIESIIAEALDQYFLNTNIAHEEPE